MKNYDMKRVTYRNLLALILLFSFSKTNAQNLPKDGLIAWFPFNGTLKDESGNGLNTFFADNNKGGVSLSEVNNLTDDRNGKAKSAFYFSGDNENKAIKVKLAKSLNLRDRTVALWVNSPSKAITHYSNIFELGYNSEVKQYCSILGDESSYVYQKRDGKISSLIAEGGFVESRSYLNDDNWHHLAVVVNSFNNSYKIYIDGKLDSDSYLPIPIINNSNPYSSNPQKPISEIPVNYLVFGNVFRNEPSCAFGGKIDDIGIWNRALNESEIFQLFDNYYTTNSKPNIRTDSRIKQFGQNTIDNVNSNTNASTLNNSANSINNENDLTPKNGQGTYTFSNGDKYVGEFRDGKKNGQGTYIFSNGEKYVGEFRNDWRNGQGTYTFPNGDKYVGEWRDDKKNGQGTYTFNNGIIQEGAYENGLYIGEDQKKRNNLSVLRFTSYDCAELVKSINSKGKNPRYNNQPKLYADEVVGPTIGEYIVQHYSNATESEFKSLINQASECVSISLNNVKPNTQNSECLIIENTKKPNLNFTIIDNRELCICCREKYKRFVLSDLEDKKRNQEVQYLNARLEEHLSKSSADENHMQNDRAKLKGYIALNYGMIGLTGSVLVDVLSPLVDLFGGSTNKTSRDREIDKYRNVSDYCSKKCEILCSK